MEIILHAGFHTTATTMIQKTLEGNSDALASHGIGYTHHRRFRRNFTIPCQHVLTDGRRHASNSELERTTAQMASFIEAEIGANTKRVIFFR